MSDAHAPGTNGWFKEVDFRLRELEQDTHYLMHPEHGVHAKIDSVKASLKSWAIALLTLLTANLVLVVVSVALMSNKG